MYKKILVPLDGSGFSEVVLPHVCELAKRAGAQVILLRVIPTPVYNTIFATTSSIPVQRNPEYDSRTQAETYLSQVALDRIPADIETQLEVSGGPTADVILDYAAGQRVDLIAMTTHGRSGLSRLVMGSVAEEIVQRSHVPVLLVRPA